MGPRWKGKGSEAKALLDPISQIVSQLQSCLVQSNTQGLLTSSGVFLVADSKQTDLLNRACFGLPVITADKDKQWFQLCMEEAFYLCYVLKCIKVVDESKCEKSYEELWVYMKSKTENFPNLFKAYSHLRVKNWVVRSGSQYGADFIAYRHHPALVHSEYAVLVLSDGNGESNARLMVWSDLHCMLRLCGSVAKTLLVLYIDKCGDKATSPSCLENFIVEERTITRWSPEKCRENQTIVNEKSSEPSRVAELEFQISQLQNDLKKVKDQLSASEAWKRQAEQDTEESKKQLLEMSLRLEESQEQLLKKSCSKETHVIEPLKASEDQDFSLESQLEVIKKEHSIDSAALASTLNEIEELKIQLKTIAESEASQTKHAELSRSGLNDLKVNLTETVALLEDMKKQIRECKESEAQAKVLVAETLMQLETAKSVE